VNCDIYCQLVTQIETSVRFQLNILLFVAYFM